MIEEKVFQALRASFKPEFLNRLDETIIFQNLTHGQLRQIVDIQLTRLEKRLADRNIEIQLTDGARIFWRKRDSTRCTAPAH